MRVALVSDAHGNAVALRAALDDLAGRNVDQIVSLGDVAQGGAQPQECLALIREAGALTVMGNSDAFLIDPALSAEPAIALQLTQRDWTLARIDLEFIHSFQPTIEVDLDGKRLLCFHGTPGDFDEVVLPEDPPDAFAGADILAGGHVHVPQLRRVGHAWYVNPGSVGFGYDHLQPDDDFRFDPWASYAIVHANGVEFHRVPFDLEELDAVTRASGLPRDWEVFDRYRRS